MFHGNLNKSENERAIGFDRELEKIPQHPSPSEVYHGTKNRQIISELKKGTDTLHVAHYLSTSVLPTVAYNFADTGAKERHVLKITNPQGNGCLVSFISKVPEEHEFLLKRNIKLKIGKPKIYKDDIEKVYEYPTIIL